MLYRPNTRTSEYTYPPYQGDEPVRVVLACDETYDDGFIGTARFVRLVFLGGGTLERSQLNRSGVEQMDREAAAIGQAHHSLIDETLRDDPWGLVEHVEEPDTADNR